MPLEAAATEGTPAPEGASPNGVTTPAPSDAPGGAPPAAVKVDAAVPEKGPKWDAALKAERKAREATKAAEKRAKDAEDKAAAKVAEVEGKLAEVAPLLEMLSKKDARALLQHLGMGAVDVARMVADEGKPPTVEEIQERATAAALAKVAEDQKKRDDAAAEAKKKADADAATAAEKAKEDRFIAAVSKEFKGLEAELAAGADKYKSLGTLDKLLPALGLDKGVSHVEWGTDDKGEPRTVKLQGGTATQRAALEVILAAAGRGERITVSEALETVQKQALPVLRELLQQTAELPDAGGEPGKKNDQKKNGGAAQPTLSARHTTGPVISPKGDDDDDSRTGAPMDAVLKAASRVKGLAQRLNLPT